MHNQSVSPTLGNVWALDQMWQARQRTFGERSPILHKPAALVPDLKFTLQNAGTDDGRQSFGGERAGGKSPKNCLLFYRLGQVWSAWEYQAFPSMQNRAGRSPRHHPHGLPLSNSIRSMYHYPSTCARMHTHMHARMHMYTHTPHMRMCTHTHTHAHAHDYTHADLNTIVL